MIYLDGSVIKKLREQRKMTQRELAGRLCVSDKAISKWETGRGLPDISILPELAETLGVSLTELMTGNIVTNDNRSANMLKTGFYVCPVCGNIIHSVGGGAYSCCGVTLPRLEAEAEDEEHLFTMEKTDGEYYVRLRHDMSRTHYISFLAFVTSDTVQLKKLYPQQDCDGRFAIRGGGYLYAFCNRHGLFVKKV